MTPHRSPHNSASPERRDRRPHLRDAQLAALTLAARLRYLTVLLLVLHLGVEPDAAYRLLRRLQRLGFLRCFPWRPGARPGPPTLVATLTAAGAAHLGESAGIDRADLARSVKATHARACAVEAGQVTTLGHDLDVLALHGLLLRAVGHPAGLPSIAACSWNVRAVATPCLGLGALTQHERAQLRLGAVTSTADAITYIPDAVVPLRGDDGLPGGALLVEVEMGKGGRSPEEVGAVKAAKMHAVFARLGARGAPTPLGALDPDNVAFLAWCPTARHRDRFLAGARRALGGADLPLVATAGDDAPLTLPPGHPKPAIVGWLQSASAALERPIWVNLSGETIAVLDSGTPPPVPCVEPRAGIPVAVPSNPARFDPFGPKPLLRT